MRAYVRIWSADGAKEPEETNLSTDIEVNIIEPCDRVIKMSLIVCHTSVVQWIFVRLAFCCCFSLV